MLRTSPLLALALALGLVHLSLGASGDDRSSNVEETSSSAMHRDRASAFLRNHALKQLGNNRYSAQTAHKINRAVNKGDVNSVERALEARIRAERQRMHATGIADQAKAELMEAESWFRSITRHGHKVEAMEKLPDDMLSAMNVEADPCEDFYEYACGGYLKEHEIPGYLTAKSKAWDTAKDTVLTEATELFAKDDSEVGRYYQSCMDEEAVEELGVSPLGPWLQAVAEVDSFRALANFLSVSAIYNWGSFFGWKVQEDSKDEEAMMFTVSHIGLALPDRSYYVEEGEEMEGHRRALEGVMRELLALINGGDEAAAEAEAKKAMAVETALATAMCSKERFRNIHAIHISREQIKKNSPSFHWDAYFEGIGLGQLGVEEGVAPRLAVHDWKYLQEVERLVWTQFEFQDFRAYLRWRLAYIYQGYLPKAFGKAGAALNWELYGMTESSPRWRKCYWVTIRAFKEPAARLFVEHYFSEDTEAAAMEMLANVRVAFEDHLQTLEWMDNATRGNAIGKLEAMHFEVGYPPTWPEMANWQPLQLDGGFFADMEKIALQHSEMEREKLFEKPDREKWTHAATTVNAYYSRAKNALFIPAGILQQPFFSADFPPARNYGGIGAILGHEITHGFDDNGRKYDAEGNRLNWWDKETDKDFDRKAACMARQFSEYTVSGDKHVNGNLTLGENIADSGGLRMAYYAFLSQQPHAQDLDRRAFFLSYAQLWCAVQREKSEQAHVVGGVHSPKRWRVIGTLSDSEEFADAFMCPAGSPMNPEKKCVVW